MTYFVRPRTRRLSWIHDDKVGHRHPGRNRDVVRHAPSQDVGHPQDQREVVLEEEEGGDGGEGDPPR
jgi:hypothetical protein